MYVNANCRYSETADASVFVTANPLAAARDYTFAGLTNARRYCVAYKLHSSRSQGLSMAIRVIGGEIGIKTSRAQGF
jgi:hypothetical protein